MQSRKRLISAQINEQPITVEPGETVLQAALRHGIEFPSSCRVGGCGTCKCWLTAGRVKELTETGYLLTADEVDQGYILACQSVPRSDIGVAVDLAPRASQLRVSGRVLAQRKVTHDITSLSVQLDGPMPYGAGQFANVSIEGLDGLARSYSFSAQARDEVSFLVRKVPGGRFSSLVIDQDVVGRSVRVDGPSGDFWLRPSGAPLLLVAGGERPRADPGDPKGSPVRRRRAVGHAALRRTRGAGPLCPRRDRVDRTRVAWCVPLRPGALGRGRRRDLDG
jgi:ferredoxin